MSEHLKASPPRMVSVAEIQARYTISPPPSQRWISAKAKRHRLGKQHGKVFLVREDFIERYSEIDECPASEKRPRKTARPPTRGAGASRSGAKTAKSAMSPLNEALELARLPKPASAANR